MGLKYHTVIVVPHSRAKFRKWRVSNRQIKIALATVAIVTLAAGLSIYSYFATSINLDEVARLEQENAQLRELNESFETSISSLETQLGAYEDRTNELAIVAGLEGVPSPAERRADSATGAGGSSSTDGIPTHYDLNRLNLRAQSLESQLDEIGEQLEERTLWISSTPAVSPVRGVFTSRYGTRRDPITGRRAFHHGVDISAQRGSPVVATADGIVTRSGVIGSLGRAVYVSHGFGLSTRYGHLLKLAVEPGERVKRGDVIGYVGNSGRSTGYHLHYEVREANKPVNPLTYVHDLPLR